MTHILSTSARILAVLVMMICFAGPLRADPVVTIVEGGDNPLIIPTLATSLGPFTIDNTGRLTLTIGNGTSFHFLDLHIRFSPPVNVPITADGGTVFDIADPSPGGVDFVVGQSGTGIRPGRNVRIIFDDFPAGTMITEITGTIPEPASLLLLGTGVAGAAIKVRKKLKRRNSER